LKCLSNSFDDVAKHVYSIQVYIYIYKNTHTHTHTYSMNRVLTGIEDDVSKLCNLIRDYNRVWEKKKDLKLFWGTSSRLNPFSWPEITTFSQNIWEERKEKNSKTFVMEDKGKDKVVNMVCIESVNNSLKDEYLFDFILGLTLA